MMSDHADSMTSDHAVDIDKHVRIYITVFVALMVLTIITVAISRVHLPIPMAVAATMKSQRKAEWTRQDSQS